MSNQNPLELKPITQGKFHSTAPRGIYTSWGSMKSRCQNPKCSAYHRYGGRGIKVCERWQSFDNFYVDMIESWSEGLEIERIDNNGNYDKSNCRWATILDQANNRRTSRILTAKGKSQTVAQWARELAMCQFTIHRRLEAGYSEEKALFGIFKKGPKPK